MQRRNPYQPALDKARRDLGGRDPHAVALCSGAELTTGPEGPVVALPYWGRCLAVAWHTGEVRAACGEPVSAVLQLLALHYLVTANGTPVADRWLAFRELPNGRVYDAAFRRRACVPLARAFGQRPDLFMSAGERLGGQRLLYGDASFMFQVFPRVRVAIILHRADDEFPADATVLFDASLGHYLPIEDVAVLGGLVAAELLRSGTPREAP